MKSTCTPAEVPWKTVIAGSSDIRATKLSVWDTVVLPGAPTSIGAPRFTIRTVLADGASLRRNGAGLDSTKPT